MKTLTPRTRRFPYLQELFFIGKATSHRTQKIPYGRHDFSKLLRYILQAVLAYKTSPLALLRRVIGQGIGQRGDVRAGLLRHSSASRYGRMTFSTRHMHAYAMSLSS